MLEYLKALAARLLRRGPGPFFLPPEDPRAGVRVPRRHGPGGRSSAIALDEPTEGTSVHAYGTRRTRTDDAPR